MNYYFIQLFKNLRYKVFFLIVLIACESSDSVDTTDIIPRFHFTVNIPEPSSHKYSVQMKISDWQKDTLILKMPQWMPGYYQIMNYAEDVRELSVFDQNNRLLLTQKLNNNSWEVIGVKNKELLVKYEIQTSKQFVANSYVDSTHAYIIPENSFFYVEEYKNIPVYVTVNLNPNWSKIATGLKETNTDSNEFYASDFDVLYDCPILIGNLDELPSFYVRGVGHHFVGYQIGDFDHDLFMTNLMKVVEAAVDIIGDIPYDKYTFIGIGPGQGGIEHLNNTTVSFDGNHLKSEESMNGMMNFLAHEYFHHYNVKRIRPFELGPFDYDQGSRTNLLWVSEGLSVYYEYLIVKRAGLSSEEELFADLESNINLVENNPGRLHQSLIQASYNTWKDGPFGSQGEDPGKAISYYKKGPIVGWLLDFAIRLETQNEKSLDDVMRLLYWKYYKSEGRGFTDAEFQQACETIAEASLSEIFEYVNTTKPLDYNKYLNKAGLTLDQNGDRYKVARLPNLDSFQRSILTSWLGE